MTCITKIQYLLIVLALCLTACEGDVYQSPIPDVSVHLDLNLATQYPTFKGSTCQYLLFTEPKYETDRVGYGGVLVCTDYLGNYVAYDLACPVEAKMNVRVEVDGMFAVCPSCGETYDWATSSGIPQKGISKYPLKQYKTYLSGNVLHVYLK